MFLAKLRHGDILMQLEIYDVASIPYIGIKVGISALVGWRKV